MSDVAALHGEQSGAFGVDGSEESVGEGVSGAGVLGAVPVVGCGTPVVGRGVAVVGGGVPGGDAAGDGVGGRGGGGGGAS